MGLHQRPAAFELLAVELELEMALGIARDGIAFRDPRSPVPQQYCTAAVLLCGVPFQRHGALRLWVSKSAALEPAASSALALGRRLRRATGRGDDTKRSLAGCFQLG